MQAKGQEKETLSLTLPWPPSVNNYWRSVIINKRLRVLLSKLGRKYQVDSQAMVWGQHGKLTPLSGRLSVTLRVYQPDRRRRDIDNLTKGALDALKLVGAIVDDCQIDELLVTRHGIPIDKSGGKIVVEIHKLHNENLTT